MDYLEYDIWDGTAEPASWPAVERFLQQSQRNEADRLERELDRIAAQLDRRDDLHDDIVDELEWDLERYTDELERLQKTNTGTTDGTRERLKDRIAAVKEALREERRQHWRDRQDLERERRAVLRDLAEVTDESISELLEGN